MSEKPLYNGILFSGEIPGIMAEETVRDRRFTMVTRHFHKSLELYFLLEGERFYFIDHDTYHVQAGMAVLIDRNQIHKTSAAGGRPLHSRFLLQIDAEQLSPYFRLLGFSGTDAFAHQYRGLAEFSAADWKTVLTLIEGIKQEMQALKNPANASPADATARRTANMQNADQVTGQKISARQTASAQNADQVTGQKISARKTASAQNADQTARQKTAARSYVNPAAEKIITLHTLELLLLFSRSRAETVASQWKQPDLRHTVHTGMYQKVHEIASYLQSNSADDISLEDLSARFFISRSYLTRIFKAVTGFTVTEYQTFCRIKKAQLLLTETALSITEISEQTGFGNLTYFERIFRRLTTQTPLQYRKAARREGER